MAVKTEMVGSAVAPDDKTTPRLGYSFEVVDAPAWTRRADIRAAFPFLDRVMGRVLPSQDYAFLDHGRWRLQRPPNEASVAGLEESGFFNCPVPDPRPDSPCR